MRQKHIPKFFINAFYESKFRDNLFIIKAGGKIIEDDKARDNLIRDIKELTLHGIKVLLIYGGGRLMDKMAADRGIAVTKHEGRRVTTKADLDLMKQGIGGTLSLKVYETMAANDLDGLSLNAIPPDWLNVSLRPKEPIDFGFVGDIHSALPRPINRLFRVVDFIASPCLAYAEEGTVCNINADTIATQIAIGTKAHKLMFLSDVDGVNINGETAFIITTEEIGDLIANGTVTGGMSVKIQNCRTALEAGVKRIHLINGLRENALRKEIFEPVGPGTMLITEAERDSYLQEVEAQKLIEAQT